MGEVEQYRMKMQMDKMQKKFEPDEELEKALLRDIETAWNNWLAYNALVLEYERG